MADKGAALNKRVWKLFETLKFKTRPNSIDRSEEVVVLEGGKKRTLDLLAVDETLRVKIIGWNKSGGVSGSLTTHFHDYEKLKKKTGANAVLFVVTSKRISSEDRSYAEKIGVRIWTNEELKYYESLVATIWEFAKYEIIHALGVTTKEEKSVFNVLALRIRQPFTASTSELYLFTVRPDLLLRTSVVLRKVTGNKDAYQRVIHRKRLLNIKKFLSDSDALLPPNIIVHLSDDVTWSEIKLPSVNKEGKAINLSRIGDYELVSLNIPKKYASLEIIDGQHRLFGFAHVEQHIRDDFNLVVSGISNLSNKRRTETFVAINDNARRVDPNLVAYLKYEPNESVCQSDQELMAIKVVIELNKTTPFRGKIRLVDTGSQRITLKGFAGYDLRGLLGPRGALRQYYPNNRSDEYIGALRVYFGVLKELFPKQWGDPDRYVIFTNRGISAFLKVLRSILATEQMGISYKVVRKYLSTIRKGWTDSKWITKELGNSYVGSKGWKDFHRDLVATIREEYEDFKEK